MYYATIGVDGSGLTNQIFSLITSIINAYKEGHKVVVVDIFRNDVAKPTSSLISNIFNINETNVFLKKNYDIIIVDKYNINFQIISATYGYDETNYIDLTDYFLNDYYKDNKLFISKFFCFNHIKGDPCDGIIKKFILKYKINDNYIEEIYDENLRPDIIIDFHGGPYRWRFEWINSFNDNMFDKILSNIIYNDDFISKSESIIQKINTDNKINVIHLRLEDDGITHWSRINNISKDQYKEILEQKYIHLIQNYLNESDQNIILSNSSSNGVIDFLNQHNYNYMFIDKIFNEREKDAIIDLLVSKCCNNIFIASFNMTNLNGSTFSYYIWKCMKDTVSKMYIDLEKIYDTEVVVNTN